MTATPKPKGKTPKRPDPMGDLVANAIDFLTLATEESRDGRSTRSSRFIRPLNWCSKLG
jgi:hypothetical protein